MNEKRKLRVLDLFSGIGGFSLGLERAGGFETVAFCEIEEYPRRVLAKHWPGVPCYDDVRTLTADTLRRDGIAVDVICGGFPCQDLSFAGKRAGLSGERSGLWGEYRRLIGELRPRFVIAENVPGILSLGLGSVLGDLAALGYDACWECIPASAVGAPHRRDRWWLVANAANAGSGWGQQFTESRQGSGNVAHPNQSRSQGRNGAIVRECSGKRTAGTSCAYVADAAGSGRLQGHQDAGRRSARTGTSEEWSGLTDASWWLSEPDVGRVAHGVPDRAHRLKALGNAVVPQIPELIGKAIMQAEGGMTNTITTEGRL